MGEYQCLACRDRSVSVFLNLDQVPVLCNQLCATREAALSAARGSIRLGICSACGMIQNVDFDRGLVNYSQTYENSLHFSSLFQSYAEALAARLTEQYNLRGKNIVEIGCGQGEFLEILCRNGANRGFGFDPSYKGTAHAHTNGSTDVVTIVPDCYSSAYSRLAPDFVCCRQVLEHVDEPIVFLQELRRAIGHRKDVVVFFEVPNMLQTLRSTAICDIVYEHCSYFTETSLRWLFASSGFDVLQTSETYEQQFLCVEATPAENVSLASPGEEIKDLFELACKFGRLQSSRLANWRRYLEEQGEAARIVVWGAGARGVSFLNLLRVREQIRYIVDVNPRKHGMFLAGTGQEIVPPGFLKDYRPDVVIIMNPLYASEIRETLDELSVSTELRCVLDAEVS